MKYDAIIVLAGGFDSKGNLPKTVRERIQLAATLFKEKKANHIILTGKWSNYWDHAYILPKKTESSLMFDYALPLGIQKKSLYIEDNSQNTYENIFYCKKIFFEPNNWKKILIVTSDFHTFRVNKICTLLLSKEYHFRIIATRTERTLFKKVRWQLKEQLLLRTQWFFKNILNRYQ